MIDRNGTIGCLLAAVMLIPAAAFAVSVPPTPEARIVVIVDTLDEVPSRTRSRRSARRHRLAHAPIIDFLAEAQGWTFNEAWPLQTIGQTWLVFNDTRSAAEDELGQIAAVHAKIRGIYRATTLSVRANDVADDAEPVHPAERIDIGISRRWSTGRGVRAALVGTGADRRHADIRERIVEARDFTGRRMRQFDEEAHGTAMASVVAGTGQAGVHGVAPGADLLMLRACVQAKPGFFAAECDSVQVARAMDYAMQRDVQLLILAVDTAEDPLLRPLVAAANERGIVVTGPSRANARNAVAPGSVDIVQVLPEAAADPERPFLAAPAGKIYVALPGGKFGTLRGRSATTAMAGGVVALLLQRKPHMGSGVIVKHLQQNADAETSSISACRAVANAIGLSCDAETVTADSLYARPPN